MVRFLVNIPETLRMYLKQTAKTKGQTLNGLIREILWDWADKQK